MNHNKLTLIIFFIAYPIYLDISIEEDVNLIAAIVTKKSPTFVEEVCFKLESAFSVYIVNDPARNNDERACTRNYDTDVCIPKERCYAGFCYDNALENRIRLSMWFFIPDQSNGVETQVVT